MTDLWLESRNWSDYSGVTRFFFLSVVNHIFASVFNRSRCQQVRKNARDFLDFLIFALNQAWLHCIRKIWCRLLIQITLTLTRVSWRSWFEISSTKGAKWKFSRQIFAKKSKEFWPGWASRRSVSWMTFVFSVCLQLAEYPFAGKVCVLASVEISFSEKFSSPG